MVSSTGISGGCRNLKHSEMLKKILFCFTALTIYGASAQELIPYCTKSGQWGYCDRQGNIVIAPSYKKAEPFKNNAAVVSTWTNEQLINAKGEVLIEGTSIVNNSMVEKGCVFVYNGGKVQLISLTDKKPVGKAHKSVTGECYAGISPVSDNEKNYYLVNEHNQQVESHPDWIKEVFEGFDGRNTRYNYVPSQELHICTPQKGPLCKANAVANKDTFNYLVTTYKKQGLIAGKKEDSYYLLDTNGRYTDTTAFSFTGLNKDYYFYCTENTGTICGPNGKKTFHYDSGMRLGSATGHIMQYFIESGDSMHCCYRDMNTGELLFDMVFANTNLNATPVINNKALVYIESSEWKNKRIILHNKKIEVKIDTIEIESYYTIFRNGQFYWLRGDNITPSYFRFFFKHGVMDSICGYDGKVTGTLNRNCVFDQTSYEDEKGEIRPTMVYQHYVADIQSGLITRKQDSLVLLHSEYLPLDEQNRERFEVRWRDDYQRELEPMSKNGNWCLDLDGNVVFKLIEDKLILMEKGSVTKEIANITYVGYDKDLDLFLTDRGYFSKDCKTFYFEE